MGRNLHDHNSSGLAALLLLQRSVGDHAGSSFPPEVLGFDWLGVEPSSGLLTKLHLAAVLPLGTAMLEGAGPAADQTGDSSPQRLHPSSLAPSIVRVLLPQQAGS